MEVEAFSFPLPFVNMAFLGSVFSFRKAHLALSSNFPIITDIVFSQLPFFEVEARWLIILIRGRGTPSCYRCSWNGELDHYETFTDTVRSCFSSPPLCLKLQAGLGCGLCGFVQADFFVTSFFSVESTNSFIEQNFASV